MAAPAPAAAAVAASVASAPSVVPPPAAAVPGVASAAITGGVVTTQTFDQQSAFVGRVAFVPFKGQDYLVHVGANTTVVIKPAASGPDVAPGVSTTLRLRDRPEIRVDAQRSIQRCYLKTFADVVVEEANVHGRGEPLEPGFEVVDVAATLEVCEG